MLAAFQLPATGFELMKTGQFNQRSGTGISTKLGQVCSNAAAVSSNSADEQSECHIATGLPGQCMLTA